MKPISHETRELLNRLSQRSSVVGRLFGEHPDETELLALIAAAGEPASIFPLLRFTLGTGAVAEAAAAAIARILSTIPVLELARLDDWARDLAPYGSDQPLEWDRLKPGGVPALGRLNHGWAVLAIATMHRRGYVREAALRQLAVARAGNTLPFLLLRMNDWVDPVRRVAEAAMQAFVRSPDPEALVAVLPLLLQMQVWGRREFQLFVASLLSILQRDDCRRALARGLESADRRVRRECLRLALSAPELDPEEASRFAERGLTDPDDMVRLQVARYLPSLDDEPFRRMAAAALADRWTRVRREALAAWVKRFPAEAAPVLRDALLDLHVSVRELARHRLEQEPGGFDAAAFYRGAVRMETASRLRGAILGLSETGEAADAPGLLPFCAHPAVKVREAAVRALGRLDAENSVDVVLAALTDPSPRVSKQARRVLEEQWALPIEDWIWEVVQGDSHPLHGRLNALHALAARPRWARLSFLLRAVGAPDPNVATAAREHLHKWLTTRHRSFRKPAPEHVRRIQDALGGAAPALDAAVLNSIRDELGYWLRSG